MKTLRTFLSFRGVSGGATLGSATGWLATVGMVVGMGALMLVSGCSRREDAAPHFQAAEDHFQKRDFEKAKIEYFNTLRLQPTNGLAVMRLGKILIAQGQYIEAARFVAWSRRAFPEDIETRSAFIELLALAPGETNRMTLRTEIDELLQRDPANEKAILVLLSTARDAGALADASRRVAELQAKVGDRPVFKLVEAEVQRRRGDTNAAEASIRAAIALEPKNASVHAAYASYLFGQRRTEEGEAVLRQAAELAPPYSQVRETWARYLRQVGRGEEARSVLEGIVREAPERVSAWVGLAELDLSKRNLEQAEKSLSRALGQAPNDAEARRVLAQLRMVQGKPAVAVQELEKVVAQQPGSSRSLYQLGIAHLINEDLPNAEGALEQSLRGSPGFVSAAMLLAELKLNRGNASEACTALRDLIHRHPDLQQAHLLLLRAERAAGREAEALAVAEAARRRFTNNPEFAFQQGILLRQLRRTTDARAAFEDAARLTSNHIAAVGQLVALDLLAKDGPGALRRAQTNLDTHPSDPYAWLLKSEVHLALGEAEPSEAAARKAIELAPTNAAAYKALASASIAAGRRKEASAALDKVLQWQPNDPQTLLVQGELRSSFGEHTKALEHYEAALRANPESALIQNNIAYLLSEHLGQPDRAREAALKARKQAPDNPSVADTLGWIEYRRGQYAEALRFISEAAAKAGRLPEIQYHLGMTHYMLGDEQAARTALGKAVEGTNQFSGRETAREFLALLRSGEGKVDAATLQTLEKRCREVPTDVISLARLGAAYQQLGQPDRALQSLEAALKLSPKSVPILLRLSELHAGALDQPAKGLELARRARDLAPADPEVGLILGRVAFRNGDHALAYSVLKESDRVLNRRADLAHQLAWAAFSQGRLDEAAQTMTNVVPFGGDATLVESASVFLEMVEIARRTPPPSEAVGRIAKVLEKEPGHGPALYASGLLAETQGKFLDARTSYERLVKLYPGFLPAVRQLALLCAERLGDDAAARDLGRRVREAYPRDDVLAAALGKVACRGGDWAYAESLLALAARTRTQDASLFYYLGVACQELKKPVDAATHLQKALQMEPQASFAPEARRRLEQLKEG